MQITQNIYKSVQEERAMSLRQGYNFLLLLLPKPEKKVPGGGGGG
jgi:hypothetical protein